MPVGSISSSKDTLGIAVVNYPAPYASTQKEVLDNCKKISEYIKRAKNGYPGLDLIVFPECSTQGVSNIDNLITTVPGRETDVLAQACKENNVWGVFSLTAELNKHGNPFNCFLLINDKGEIKLNYHKINPWVPGEPSFPGDTTKVALGPKGLMIGAAICYDTNFPEMIRDVVMKGAELVVRISAYPYPAQEQKVRVSNVRAWENLAYFACASLAGSDKHYSYIGHSTIISFDGTTITECSTAPDELTYAELSISSIRNARKNWTSENHLYNLTHRGYSAIQDGKSEIPYDFYKIWVNSPEKAKKLCEQITHHSTN